MSNRSGVSNGVISTPEGGGAIRGIGETFSPDLHTGTGNFTVPISLPAGRNDFQPELNLGYSTGDGNGPFGFGWRLSVPGVTRKTSDGVPRYRDGTGEPSDWDTFVLSGAEDLVPVSVWDAGGAGDDALVENENPTAEAFATAPVVQFRPRTEESFARIRQHRGGNDDYWEVERTDGQVSYYGTPAPDDADAEWEDPAVLADPQRDGDVFAWKLTETRDSFGNRIVYDYERDRTVTGSGGWNQLYLKRIRYADYDGTDDTEFLVSVEFDYEDRPDPFSDYRAGFEIRTRKRCTRITVSTHAEEDRRFKTYELTYLDQRDDLADREARLPLNGVSLLSQLTVAGHDDGARQALPPLEFGHTQFRPSEREFAPVEGAELPAESLGAPDLELTDLFGDGLPDVVEIDGRVRYWRNEGGGEFERPRPMERSPAGLSLADPDVQLLDADGDGRADLMTERDGLAGYFPLDFDGKWSREGFRRYDRAPSVDLQDPEVRLVDLTGDGVTDAVRSGSRFECYFNDPDEGWAETRRVQRRSLEAFPDVRFSDRRVRFADMTGDGLQDVVLLHDGNVEYWPNLGYGDWGRRVHMAESPRFPEGYDPERLLVGDVDGDGAADLVYVADDAVTLWVNRSGNGWSDPVEVDGTPSVTDATDVRLVDLLGIGVAGVLWSDDADGRGRGRDRAFFLDFTGRTKPYLLDEMDNNIGAVTRVEYGTSTEHLLDDRGDPQARRETPLPFPVQVVDRVEVIDAVSRSKQTTEYAYQHGYWDGDEREFRGFGMVEQYDTQTFADYNAPGLHGTDVDFRAVDDREQFSPPTLTKTWFHQGAVGPARGEWHRADYSDGYWDGDEQLLGEAASLDAFLEDADVPRRAKRDALRTLRGRVVRRERYALDGSDRADRPYTVTEYRHSLREEDATDGRVDRPRVYFPHTVAERTTHWERGLDPLTTFTFRGDFDEHGQPRRETRVAPPRRSAERAGTTVAERGHLSGDELNETQVLATHTRTEYADPQGDSFIHDRISQARTVELRDPPTVSESDPGDVGQVLRDQTEAARTVRRTFVDAMDTWQTDHSLPSTVRLVGHTVNHYDGSAFEGLSPGAVDEYGALTRSETLVFRDEQLDEAYGNRQPAYLGGSASLPNGAPDDVGQDLGYRHEPSSSGEYHAGYYTDTDRRRYDVQDDATDETRGVVTATEDPLGHRTTIDPDDYWIRPKRVTDPAGLVRAAEYDYRVLDPKTVRDPNGHATHLRYTPLGQVRKRFVESREGAGGSESKPEVRYEYDFQSYERTRENDEPQPISVHAFRRVHHASDSSSDETIESREYSDGFGRLVQKRTQAPELAFGTLGNGVGLPGDQDASVAPADGGRDANRVVVSGWKVYDNKGQVVESYEPFFASGWDYDPEGDARQGQHVTRHYDPRGRVVRTVNPDESEQRVVFGVPESLSSPEPNEPTPWERYAYDANDNAGRTHQADSALDSVDHHQNTPVRGVRDALGRTIAAVEHTRDPGQQRERYLTQLRYDIRGNETETVDPLGRSVVEYAYDLLDNRLRTASIDDGLETVVRDASGNPIETRDGKGSVVLREYDELNRLTKLWARADDSVNRVTLGERRTYGDDDAVDESTARDGNLRGQLYEHYDEAGLVRFDGYDFTGNVAKKTRRAVSDEALSGGWTADWSAANADDDLGSGYVIETSYDALSRPTRVRYPADVGGARAELSPTYDRAGRLESVGLDDRTYVEQLAYNARGQRTLAAYGNDVMTRYAYDPETVRLARLRTEAFQQGSTADTWEGTGAPLQEFGYDYDLVGNVLAIDDRTPDSGVPGTSHGPDRLVRTFAYDPLYRLTNATGREHDVSYPKSDPWDDRQGHRSPAQTREYERHYSYDPADNVERLRHVAAGETVTRDIETESGSNRMASLTVDDGTTTRYDYEYDDGGNLIREGPDRRFDWDHTDRMRSFETQAGRGDSTVDVYHLYDADGRRVKKLVENGSTAKSTTYVDGVFEHHRWKQGGTLERENNRLHVMDDRKRIALVRRGPAHPDDAKPAVQYHLGDHLGSSNVVAGQNGQARNREEYFPYGETSFGSVAGKRYRFTGKERDEASSLYYHGARYYAPWLGRWTASDPKGLVDGVNQFAYGRDNPVRMVDRDGLQSSDQVDTIRVFTPEPSSVFQTTSGASGPRTSLSEGQFSERSGLHKVLEKDPTLGEHASHVWMSKSNDAVHLRYSKPGQPSSITYVNMNEEVATELANRIASKFGELRTVGSTSGMARHISDEVLAAKTIRTERSATTLFLVKRQRRGLEWVAPKEPLVRAMEDYLSESAVGSYGGEYYNTREDLTEIRARIRTTVLNRMRSSPIAAILGGGAAAAGSGLKGLDIATALGKTAWAPINAYGSSVQRRNETATTVERNTIFERRPGAYGSE